MFDFQELTIKVKGGKAGESQGSRQGGAVTTASHTPGAPCNLRAPHVSISRLWQHCPPFVESTASAVHHLCVTVHTYQPLGVKQKGFGTDSCILCCPWLSYKSSLAVNH